MYQSKLYFIKREHIKNKQTGTNYAQSMVMNFPRNTYPFPQKEQKGAYKFWAIGLQNLLQVPDSTFAFLQCQSRMNNQMDHQVEYKLAWKMQSPW